MTRLLAEPFPIVIFIFPGELLRHILFCGQGGVEDPSMSRARRRAIVCGGLLHQLRSLHLRKRDDARLATAESI